MKILLSAVIWISALANLLAQDSLRQETETALRNKGVIIDLGVNHFYHNTNNLKLKTLSSRGANIYLFNKLNPQSEHVQFRIGFGVGLDNYSFKKDVSLGTLRDTTVFMKGNSVGNDTIDFIKSKISINHFDVPVEVVFQSRNGSGAFKVALGVRVGWVFDVHTKRVIEINGSKSIEKIKADFNVQRMRYGLTARVMYSGFNFFFMHNLSPLFQKGRGEALASFMTGVSILID